MKRNNSAVIIKPELRTRLRYYKQMYLLILPGLILLAIFKYVPIYGLSIAFKDYNIMQGILRSPWAGLKYFKEAFQDDFFLNTLRNTFVISGLKLFIGFPVPILIALLLNELRNNFVKKVMQTFTYFPYFISWVVLAGIFLRIFSPEGPINFVRGLFGKAPVLYFAEPGAFLTIVVGTHIWREMGWSAVIYLAALANIDPQLYESADMDGANRFQQAVHITLPSLMPVAIILLILNIGFILNAGFDQIYNLYNPMVLDIGEIIDTYVYKKGIVEFNYSYGAAVGFFKSVVGLVLIYFTNRIAVIFGGKENGLW
ncbi:MAG: ABC transporter permease [Spirochaetia bacterium]